MGRVCGVTKLLQTALYPNVIIKRDRWRKERVLKEEEFISTYDPIWHEAQHVCFKIKNITIYCTKSVVIEECSNVGDIY